MITPNGPPPPALPAAIELVIRFTPTGPTPFDGQVEVHGPLHQRLLCYGLLDLAREIIARRQPGGPAQGSGLVLARPLG